VESGRIERGQNVSFFYYSHENGVSHPLGENPIYHPRACLSVGK